MAKKISIIAKDRLKKLDIDTLVSLNEIRSDLSLRDAFLKMVRQLIEEEKDYIISLNSADPDLRTKHANSLGRVGGLTEFIHMLEGSGDEIERREK